jgi:hypothetical protein
MRFISFLLFALLADSVFAGDCRKVRCWKPVRCCKILKLQRSVDSARTVKKDCSVKKVERSRTVKQSLKIGSYQLEAERQVKYMAERNIRGHVMSTIGDFEGVGWSSSGTPETCKPRCFGSAKCSFKLVADAQVTNENGTFRLRSWVKQ